MAVDFFFTLHHRCQTWARGPNLALAVIIFGPQDHIICTRVGPPVYVPYILTGSVVSAVYVLGYSTYILVFCL